jgi:hypothetical protein
MGRRNRKMELTMAACRQGGWREHPCVSAFVLFAFVLFGCVAAMQPASAQTRSLASLADVPIYVPAPYHPHTATAVYGAALYDDYYGGAHWGAGPHYWH